MQNKLIRMYANYESLEDVHKVFICMTTIIAGYA